MSKFAVKTCAMYGQQGPLEFNFKGTNSSDNPPPVPARHFSANSADDLPPPLPERRCSLDSGVDEEFQGRFVFRPLSTAPLPEVYGNCSKSYPSKMYQAFQRPVHHPPPPPLPTDLFPSPTEEKTISFTTRSVPQQLKPAKTSSSKSHASPTFNRTTPLEDSFEQSVYNDVPDDDLDLPPPPVRRLPPRPLSKMNTASTVSPKEEKTTSFTPRSFPEQLKPATTPGSKSPTSPAFSGTTPLDASLEQSVYNDVPDDDLDFPPPPARRLPPPPLSKMKTASTLSKVVSSSAPVSTAGILKSPKLNGVSHLKPLAIPPADSQITHSLDSLPSTPPLTPPLPPPPPPPQSLTTSGVSQQMNKHTEINGLPKQNDSNAFSATLHDKEMKNDKELPQLPDKPSETCTGLPNSSPGIRKHPPKPPAPNGISKNTARLLLSRTQKPPLPQRSASPLPSTQSAKLSVSASPMPDFSSRTNHPNKRRPLPNIPSVLTGKKGTPSKATSGWGGVEVFDPREEDGDIYDVMDSTDM